MFPKQWHRVGDEVKHIELRCRPTAIFHKICLNGVSSVAGDEAEWRQWKRVGDEVLHIELRRWADCLVLAPLSANTLAKAAHGLCDNLLTCVVRSPAGSCTACCPST